MDANAHPSADLLERLDARIRTLIPAEYQASYEEMQPVPMRSAGLKFDADGRVAWDEIWGSFCDLAMAGGPPHKGALLAPGTRAEVEANRDRYTEVTDEIRRGIEMVTELPAELSPTPGWVRVTCLNQTMAQWLLRAIVVENVSVQREHHMLDLPASPHFRLEKEIKNVITVIAKTCHYWMGHMPHAQQRAIGDLLTAMDAERPAIEPAYPGDDAGRSAAVALGEQIAQRVASETGLATAERIYDAWAGVDCRHERAAVWMMRALVASNVLARRERTVLFLPVNPRRDPAADDVTAAVAAVYRLAVSRGLL